MARDSAVSLWFLSRQKSANPVYSVARNESLWKQALPIVAEETFSPKLAKLLLGILATNPLGGVRDWDKQNFIGSRPLQDYRGLPATGHHLDQRRGNP